MNRALYTPALGYYQNTSYKIGSKGDFITAPELGPYFAYAIGNSLADFFNSRDNSATTNNILEIGAGSGALAFDLLQRLDQLGALPERYFILEPSAELQARQLTRIKGLPSTLAERVEWLTDLPQNFNGVMLANEVVDAIACERIKLIDQQWRQLGVGAKEGRLVELEGEVIQQTKLPTYLQSLDTQTLTDMGYIEGYHTEFRPRIAGWIKSLSQSLCQGAIVLIDYGYNQSDFYHPQRHQGSLKCFIQHHSHDDPYSLLGLQDITAHVDFSHIAEVAAQLGLSLDGFTSQAGFLLENGVTELAPQKSDGGIEQSVYRQSQQLQKLLLPGQMGEVIKVMQLGKNLSKSIKGFSLQDHRYKL
ncbi:MAG: SAM-dependent methyltransferase [Enterobacterales bacterium]|nr:SAM-dependent methyltransferase [Enterobacterales bacterium]